jgi:hypothetical protein
LRSLEFSCGFCGSAAVAWQFWVSGERIDTAEKRNTEDFSEQPSIRGDPMSHKFHPTSRPASWGAPLCGFFTWQVNGSDLRLRLEERGCRGPGFSVQPSRLGTNVATENPWLARGISQSLTLL